tara:strand:+ start:379 stop:1356 length:978 start_codon:yes stop_codon:yes gene_type:complete
MKRHQSERGHSAFETQDTVAVDDESSTIAWSSRAASMGVTGSCSVQLPSVRMLVKKMYGTRCLEAGFIVPSAIAVDVNIKAAIEVGGVRIWMNARISVVAVRRTGVSIAIEVAFAAIPPHAVLIHPVTHDLRGERMNGGVIGVAVFRHRIAIAIRVAVVGTRAIIIHSVAGDLRQERRPGRIRVVTIAVCRHPVPILIGEAQVRAVAVFIPAIAPDLICAGVTRYISVIAIYLRGIAIAVEVIGTWVTAGTTRPDYTAVFPWIHIAARTAGGARLRPRLFTGIRFPWMRVRASGSQKRHYSSAQAHRTDLHSRHLISSYPSLTTY